MNCVNHRAVEAVRTCPECGAGLCISCSGNHVHGATSSATAGVAASAFTVGAGSSHSSASAGFSSSRPVMPPPAEHLISKAYAAGRGNTRTALRLGLWMLGLGTILVLTSLMLNARGYYFLFILIALGWSLGGFAAGRNAAGMMSGLWMGFVTGGVGAIGTLVVALVVHSGRLAVFGVGTQWQAMFNTGPVLGFFDLGSPSSVSGGIGFLYMAFVAAAFSAAVTLGVLPSTAFGALSGSMLGEKDSGRTTVGSADNEEGGPR